MVTLSNIKGASVTKSVVIKGLTILLSMGFYASLPMLLTMSYMSRHGFFSYDYFAHGAFGMQAFFYVMAVALIVSAFACFSWIVLLIKKKYQGNISESSFTGWLLIIVSFLGTLYMYFKIVEIICSNSEPFVLLLFFCSFLAVLAVITIHISLLFYGERKQYLPALLTLIGMTLILLFYARPMVAGGFSTVLQHFQVGGGINIRIVGKEPNTISSGSLLLLTPERLFVQSDDQKTIHVINRNGTVIELGRKN